MKPIYFLRNNIGGSEGLSMKPIASVGMMFELTGRYLDLVTAQINKPNSIFKIVKTRATPTEPHIVVIYEIDEELVVPDNKDLLCIWGTVRELLPEMHASEHFTPKPYFVFSIPDRSPKFYCGRWTNS